MSNLFKGDGLLRARLHRGQCNCNLVFASQKSSKHKHIATAKVSQPNSKKNHKGFPRRSIFVICHRKGIEIDSVALPQKYQSPFRRKIAAYTFTVLTTNRKSSPGGDGALSLKPMLGQFLASVRPSFIHCLGVLSVNVGHVPHAWAKIILS